MSTTTPIEVLLRDLHPVELAMPDGSILTAVRAFITSHRLIAFRTGQTGIERAVDLELAGGQTIRMNRQQLASRERIAVDLADGTSVYINRGRGCGCGSPLKALGRPAPWKGTAR